MFGTRGRNKRLIASLMTVITLFSIMAVYAYSNTQDSSSVENSIIVTVSPSGSSFKLSINESKTFLAQALNGTAPFFYTWTLSSSGNITILVNGELRQVLSASSIQVFGNRLTLLYPSATEEYVNVDVSVKDANGYLGSLLAPFLVVDPYTSPNLVFEGSTATANYIIQTDGMGWYRAINGSDGSVSWSSTNFAAVFNNASSQPDASILLTTGTFTTTRTLNLHAYNTIIGQGKSTTIKLADSANCNLIKIADGAYGTTIKSLILYGNKEHNIAGNGLVSGTGFCNALIDDVYFRDFAECGALIYSPWVSIIQNCFFECNNGDGLFIYHAQDRTRMFHNEYNQNLGNGLHISDSFGISSFALSDVSSNSLGNGMNGILVQGSGNCWFSEMRLQDNSWGHPRQYSNINTSRCDNTFSNIHIYHEYPTFVYPAYDYAETDFGVIIPDRNTVTDCTFYGSVNGLSSPDWTYTIFDNLKINTYPTLPSGSFFITNDARYASLTAPFTTAGVERVYVWLDFGVAFWQSPVLTITTDKPDIVFTGITNLNQTGCYLWFSDCAGIDITTNYGVNVYWSGRI